MSAPSLYVSLVDAGCIPGRDSVPDSVLGKLMCGTWLPDNSSGWMALLHRWPYAAAGLAVVIGARTAWAWVQRLVWRAHARRAVWLEITPPVTATPAATQALWSLLVRQLAAPRRLSLRPRRLAFEVYATPDRMRAGLWVPPGFTDLQITRAVQSAWPGARLTRTRPPELPAGLPVHGRTVVAGTEAQMFVDDTTPPAELDPLRALFDGLAASGRAGAGLLQVIVSRAPARRVTVIRRAGLDPTKARRTGSGRILDVAARGLRGLLLGVLDLIQPHKPTAGTRRVSPLTDPYLAEVAAAARHKANRGPHLLIAVRVFTAAPTRAAARSVNNEAANGFGLVSRQLGIRRLHRPRHAAQYRWVAEPAMSVATIAETAAVAGLPAEPAAYGLPGAASHRRSPTADGWRPSPQQTGPAAEDDFDLWSLT